MSLPGPASPKLAPLLSVLAPLLLLSACFGVDPAGRYACDPKTQSDCCPNLCFNACADLDTDPQNCGECGIACEQGQACVGGLCTCNAGSCPIGCCQADLCQPGTSVDECGTGGAKCQNCGISTSTS